MSETIAHKSSLCRSSEGRWAQCP